MVLAGPDHAFPSAAVLAGMAHERAASAGDGRLLTPMYLRPADVRIGWAQAPSPEAQAAASGAGVPVGGVGGGPGRG
ncbi:MAG: hypothetical protein ACRDXE_03625 [Acidimicrobiales bacterium]